MTMLVLSLTIGCGGEEKKAEAPKPEPVKTAPAPTPAPPPAPTPAPAAPASGPYTPDEFAAKAYEAAKAAGADKTSANPKAGDAAAIAAGKAKFEAACASCHGTAGDGNTPAGQALPQKAASFKHKERWAYTSVGTKHWVVLNGVTGTGMASLGLTPDQGWEVLAYIESEFVGK